MWRGGADAHCCLSSVPTQASRRSAPSGMWALPMGVPPGLLGASPLCRASGNGLTLQHTCMPSCVLPSNAHVCHPVSYPPTHMYVVMCHVIGLHANRCHLCPAMSLHALNLPNLPFVQGDWQCPACVAGQPPRPRSGNTVVEKVMSRQLSIVRLEALWQLPCGSLHFAGRWYIPPEETHTGRQVGCRHFDSAGAGVNA
jgi:hypothetical protein